MRSRPAASRRSCCRPFFWKGVSDDGLFAWYATLIERVGDPRLKLMLYHLPQVSAVPLSVDLVARLAAAFPGVVAGVKDSEGNWAHTSALLARVPELAIVIGHEPHLPRLMRAGGAGTICGVANVHAGLVRALLEPGVTADGRGAHRRVHRGDGTPSVPRELQEPAGRPAARPGLAAGARAAHGPRRGAARALREALAAAGLAPQQAEAAQ